MNPLFDAKLCIFLSMIEIYMAFTLGNIYNDSEMRGFALLGIFFLYASIVNYKEVSNGKYY